MQIPLGKSYSLSLSFSEMKYSENMSLGKKKLKRPVLSPYVFNEIPSSLPRIKINF